MKCLECGAEGPVELHHIIPRSRGGTATVPLCSACHGRAHGVNRGQIRDLTRSALAAKRRKGEKTGGGCSIWPPPCSGRSSSGA